MRIGELAEQAGMSTKAIRYYEQIGILTPPARTASGYRSYDEAALGRLGFVRATQAVGLTLGEIRQVIAFRDDEQAPCAHVTDLLRRHAADLDAHQGTPAAPRRTPAVGGASHHARSGALPAGAGLPHHHLTRRTMPGVVRRRWAGQPPLGPGPLVGASDDLPQDRPLGVGVAVAVVPEPAGGVDAGWVDGHGTDLCDSAGRKPPQLVPRRHRCR
jgi:DNA-binding transcriptional MerR regulator